MITVTTNDILSLINATIQNNYSGVVSAMNQTGNIVPTTISNTDLLAKVWTVFTSNGVDGLKKVLDLVPVDKTKDLKPFVSLGKTFGATQNSVTIKQTGGCTDFTSCLQYAGTILSGGSQTTVLPSQTITSNSSSFNPVIIVIALIGIFALILLAYWYFKIK